MRSSAALDHPTKQQDRIIVALDVATAESAFSIASELREAVGAFKVGLQLFTAAGPALVERLVGMGLKVFLDLKFHDIPNTVAKASVEAARLGVWMFNVHASGGSEMMRRTIDEVREACERESIERPKVIAVTVLTSSDRETLLETGLSGDLDLQVVRMAELTAKCCLDGIVASPLEIAPVRKSIESSRFLIVTPGIRPISATNDDQKRVMTPREALRAGADYLVIGRPITAAADRAQAVDAIIKELGS